MSEEGVGKRKPPPPPGEKPQLVQNDSRSQVAVRNYEKPSESEKTTGLDKPSDENLIDGSNTSDENAEHYKADDFRWDSYGAYLGGKAFLDFYTRLVKNRWEWFRQAMTYTSRRASNEYGE
ncbi:hypothetical protein CLAFUW4_11235 [Fulvia fulva]|uniref:Uncharacterized protein n=1 Tax=Passalora fulva TaxID=5499 RepID=A0A9Q8PDB8_PASFU|nr:uncharacterized protein CLAFUR5_10279 [Fulvia fulva]KAK4619566.1 hypothetical protein CLAFUR4_11241 [Fulvia fulva]KAK4620255.1 hypothetical protein CLAFUR0_11246 [Fulvia fulva]UJO20374.1 hypothetical protein CLAFUR5_10279 [Fulvia fulva]WPV17126.1 hypothetical protein CLAFUW4_11235 [Fulvia fulva]WPV32488.1 hypothetical protein CLAFUW7_11231 [Fulvia fulva]